MQALVCCTVQGALAPDGGWRCVQVYLVALDIASTKVVLSPTACSVSKEIPQMQARVCCTVQGELAPDGEWWCVQVI